MRNFSDFFTVDAGVPVGSYEKVRLTLSDLALVECDGTGQPEPGSDWDHPKLPGQRQARPQPARLVRGRRWRDARRSNSTWTWRSRCTCTRRATASGSSAPSSSSRSGRTTAISSVSSAPRGTSGTSSFELCPVVPVPTMDDHSPSAGTECLDVVTDVDTGIFDASGDLTDLSTLATGDLLTAIGFLVLHDDADGDDTHRRPAPRRGGARVR